jgi:hypothetical protein
MAAFNTCTIATVHVVSKEVAKRMAEEADPVRFHPDEGKVECVSNYKYWPYHGGVDAMQKEADKCGPLCASCHRLDRSSRSANRVVDRPEEEEWVGPTDCPAHKASWSRKNRRENQAYVDAYKREVGYCQHPSCPRDGPNKGKIEKGYEVCSDFDHIERAKKLAAISKIVNSGLPLKTTQPLLDAELVGTRVLCRNCHAERDPLEDT